MDCPLKNKAVVERWPLWRGGRLWRFDCTCKKQNHSFFCQTNMSLKQYVKGNKQTKNEL